jgi:FixJ family two-component response regulator
MIDHERTLLLVDDEENILRALTRLFRRDGYTVLTAAGGEQGLAVLEQQRVGVIVSDQRMPEMTGTEFLSRVKERWPDTVRLVLSGYTDLNSVTDAINRGAIYRFLTKPWDDDLLRANVREAFEQFELRGENQRLNDELAHVNRSLEQALAAQNRELGIHQRVLELSRELLEQLPVGVAGIGSDGVVAVANTCFHRLLGAADGTLLGGTSELLPPPLAAACAAPPPSHAPHVQHVSLPAGECTMHSLSLGEHSHITGALLVLVPETGHA